LIYCALKADFSSSLSAAHAAAGAQIYPISALYMVATPIGNLADISLRALHVLSLVNKIACEDTRHTQGMLGIYGISQALISVHEHNEREAAQTVIALLQAGERVAYVSDAGTPAVSDPGARLADAVRQAGLRVIPLPGASSITALVSAAGLSGDNASFVFEGFLSPKAKERDTQVQRIALESRTVVLLESPHRIGALAGALSALGDRPITIGRELTKQFEQIVTLPAGDFSAWLNQDKHHSSGEFCLAIHPQAARSETAGHGERILKLLLTELPTKTAVKLAADLSGEPKNALYDLAIQLKNSDA
jgi:16S rRNA (cytidine1402-2'-O)-methyltransferase